MNKKRFLDNLNGLAILFDKSLPAIVQALYCKTMAGFTDEQLDNVISRAAMECKFFPKPADLAEMIQGSHEDQALIAWGAVQEQIRKTGSWGFPELDAKTMAAVNDVGGWQAVCDCPADSLSVIRGQFRKHYMAAAKNPGLALPAPEERKMIESGPVEVGNWPEIQTFGERSEK